MVPAPAFLAAPHPADPGLAQAAANRRFIAIAMRLAHALDECNRHRERPEAARGQDDQERRYPLTQMLVRNEVTRHLPRVRVHPLPGLDNQVSGLAVQRTDPYLTDPNYFGHGLRFNFHLRVATLLFGRAAQPVALGPARKQAVQREVAQALGCFATITSNLFSRFDERLQGPAAHLMRPDYDTLLDTLLEALKPVVAALEALAQPCPPPRGHRRADKIMAFAAFAQLVPERPAGGNGQAAEEAQAPEAPVAQADGRVQHAAQALHDLSQRLAAVPTSKEQAQQVQGRVVAALEEAGKAPQQDKPLVAKKKIKEHVSNINTATEVTTMALELLGEDQLAREISQTTGFATGVMSDFAEAIPPTPFTVATSAVSIADRSLQFFFGVSLLGSDGPSKEDQILQQVKAISKQIVAFRKEMNQRFDRLEHILSDLQRKVLKAIGEVAKDMRKLQRTANEIRKDVQDMAEDMRKGFKDLAQGEYLRRRTGILQYYQIEPLPTRPPTEARAQHVTRDFLQVFLPWPESTPVRDTLNAPWHDGWDAAKVLSMVRAHGFAYNARVLCQYAQQHFGFVSPLPPDAIPNVVTWADGAMAVLEYLYRNPDFRLYEKQAATTREVLYQGRQYDAVMADLQAHQPTFEHLFARLEASYAQVRKVLTHHLDQASEQLQEDMERDVFLWSLLVHQALTGRYEYVTHPDYLRRTRDDKSAPLFYGIMGAKDAEHCAELLATYPTEAFFADFRWTFQSLKTLDPKQLEGGLRRAVVEALNRWQDAEFGWLAQYTPMLYMEHPGDVIPLAFRALLRTTDAAFEAGLKGLGDFLEAFMAASNEPERQAARAQLAASGFPIPVKLNPEQFFTPKIKPRIGYTMALLLPTVHRDFSLAKALIDGAPEVLTQSVARGAAYHAALHQLQEAFDLLVTYVAFAFRDRFTTDIAFRMKLLHNLRRVLEVREELVTLYEDPEAAQKSGTLPSGTVAQRTPEPPRPRFMTEVWNAPLTVRPIYAHLLFEELPGVIRETRQQVLDLAAEAARTPHADRLTRFVYEAFANFEAMYQYAADQASERPPLLDEARLPFFAET